MGSFDWSKTEKIGGGFDWGKLEDVTPESEKPSKIESALRGAAQGATLGFQDEITGALESAPKLTNVPEYMRLPGDDMDAGTTYQQSRDEARAANAKAKDANPNSYLAGELGGGLLTAAATGVPASFGSAMIVGAGMGGAAGVGGSEGKNTDEVIKDGLVGAGIGGVGGAAAHGASKLVPWALQSAGEKLRSLAKMRAVKSLAGSKNAMENLKGVPGAEDRLGELLLDEGVVSPLASKETMASRLDDLVGRKTNDLSSELKRVSEAQALATPEDALKLEASKFNPRQAADSLKSKMAEEYAFVPEKIRGKQGEVIDDWLNQPGNMDILDAQKFKTQMQKWIKDPSYQNANPGVAQETLKGIRNQIKTGIERNADTAAEIFGEQGGKIKGINQDLGGLYQGQDMLEDAIARGSKNRTFSLSDYITGNAGAAAAGPKGMALGLANKVIREKGSQVSAVAMDKASKFLLRSPRMQALAQNNPKAFSAMANDFARRFDSGIIGKVAYDPTHPIDEERAKQSFVEGN